METYLLVQHRAQWAHMGLLHGSHRVTLTHTNF